MTIEDFLRARFDEDREEAESDLVDGVYFTGQANGNDWTADRRLVETEAKRRLFDWCDSDPLMHDGSWAYIDRVLRFLALPYAGHEDYDESWRP